MITQVIPYSEWQSFCHDFSAKHYGRHAIVESLQYDGRHRVVSCDKQFEGVLVSPDTESVGVAQVELGTDLTGHQMVVVPNLQSLCIEKTESGADVGLEMHSQKLGITIIRFPSKFRRFGNPDRQ